MTSLTAIRDQIISILVAAKPKNGAGKELVRIFKGQPPPSKWPDFPWCWVEWNGGIMEVPVGSKALIRDSFFVCVVDRHVDAEKAEESIMDFVESIEAALDDFPNLGSLVSQSYVSNREKQKVFQPGDYSVCALRITLSTWRRE